MSILATAYESVTESAQLNLKGQGVSGALEDLIGLSLQFLTDKCKRQEQDPFADQDVYP